MRRLLPVARPLPLGALVALFAAGGCQLVAGVRTDAEPATGGAGSTSSDATTTTTTTTTTTDASSSSSTGSGPCTSNESCGAAGAVCVEGVCEFPKCNVNAAVELFGAAEIGADDIDEEHTALAFDGDRVYVAIVDYTKQEVLVRPVRDNGNKDPHKSIAFAGDTRFGSGRWQSSFLSFQGIVNGKIGALHWATDLNGLSGNASFVTYQNGCVGQEKPDRLAFSPLLGATKFLGLCEDATNARLIVGGDDDPNPTTLGSGLLGDPKFNVEHFVATSAGMLGFINSDNKYLWRGGKTKADLAADKPFALDADSATLDFVLGAGKTAGDDGYVLAAARFREAPPVIAELWTGLVTDVNDLSASPPPTLTMQVDGSDAPFENFGRSSAIVSSPLGYFFASRAGSRKRATVTWLSPKGQVLVFSSPVFVSPDGETSVDSAEIVMSGNQPFVVWTEKKDNAFRVRGAPLFCSY